MKIVTSFNDSNLCMGALIVGVSFVVGGVVVAPIDNVVAVVRETL